MTPRRVACSWSGGKDSCLALHVAADQGTTPCALLTVFDESGERTRSHGLRRAVLEAQADRLGIPMHTPCASWQSYEAEFVAALKGAAREGTREVVFGDIDLLEHREWEERVCEQAGMRADLPLWLEDRHAILKQVWERGIRCHIIAIDASKLPRDVLGKELTPELAREFTAKQVDACGENGEFHTVVVDAPLFSSAIPLRWGAIVARGGYLAIDAQIDCHEAD